MTIPSTAPPRTEDVVAKVTLLRRVSIIEATSYLVLLAAAVVKRAEITEVGVQIVGPIHGILFLAFALLVLRDHRLLGWSLWKVIAAVFLGSLPFGGFWFERRWLPRFGAQSHTSPPSTFHD